MTKFQPPESACAGVRRSLGSYLGGELGDAGAREVRLHLEVCPACAAAEERERVKQFVRRAVRREAAPESLRDRIREMVRRDTR